MRGYIVKLLIAALNAISKEYFVRLYFDNSPMGAVSKFIKAASPEEAADKAEEQYRGITYLAVFADANTCFKGGERLVRRVLWERKEKRKEK